MARGGQGDVGPDGPGWGHELAAIKDTVEAFAIAIVMALVIKHFCVEAFKIPTGSMQPTLLGDDHNRGGDRILVDKLAYLTSGPERFHVIVFRYPLDASRNFIKRVGGLPGERLRIVGGDLWVRRPGEDAWRIPTKPREQRDQLYFGVYPPRWGAATPEEERTWLDGAWAAETPGTWRVESRERFDFVGGSSAALVYQPQIRTTTSAADRWAGGGDGPLSRDVRVRARLVAEGPASVSVAWQVRADLAAEVRFSTEGFAEPSAVAVRGPAGPVSREIPAPLVPGRPLDVEVEVVDGEVIVHADGRELARLPLGTRIEDADDDALDPRLTLRAAGAALAVEGLRIDRDLAYLEKGLRDLDPRGEGLEIPEDCYFVLGDNTAASSDSRQWRRDCLLLKDGTRICWDGSGSGSSTSPSTWREGDAGRPPAALRARGGTVRHVTDVEGVERWWIEEDEDDGTDLRPVPTPFVRRDMVVGRAFFVFWPLLPGFPGRLQFIH